MCPSPEVGGGERVETAGGKAELFGSFGGVEGLLPKGIEHIADE